MKIELNVFIAVKQYSHIYLRGLGFICNTVISFKTIEKCYCKKKKISTAVCEKYLVYQHGYSIIILCYYGCRQCSPFLPAKQIKEFFKLVEYLGASLVMGLLSALHGIKMSHFSLLHTDTFALPSL